LLFAKQRRACALTRDSDLRIARLETQHTAVALADVAATVAADVGPRPILIHIVVLGMAMAMHALSVVGGTAILGFARRSEEEAHQHAERYEFEQGARAPP
jgi:hypothetical protein